jgi:hypothetical protein
MGAVDGVELRNASNVTRNRALLLIIIAPLAQHRESTGEDKRNARFQFSALN